VKSEFGQTVRELREGRGIGLRRFARQLGISPTYLSKIERGEFAPPAEDKVVAMADALGADRDVLLALAGRVASDLKAIIRRHPRELGALLRASRDLAPHQITGLIEGARAQRPGGGEAAMERNSRRPERPGA
jgi:transcriptional regulator with XRE-family HTH domain